MPDVEAILENLRDVESNGNYMQQERVRTSAGYDRRVGAYGVLLSRWPSLAAVAGYPGADWRDRMAQDAVMRARVNHDLDRFSADPDITDPEQAAIVSFRFGPQAATQFAKGGKARTITEYLESYDSRTKKNPEFAQTQAPKKNKTLTKAEGIVRDRLVGMRNAQRGTQEVMTDGSDEGIVQERDQDVSAGTQ